MFTNCSKSKPTDANSTAFLVYPKGQNDRPRRLEVVLQQHFNRSPAVSLVTGKYVPSART